MTQNSSLVVHDALGNPNDLPHTAEFLQVRLNLCFVQLGIAAGMKQALLCGDEGALACREGEREEHTPS